MKERLEALGGEIAPRTERPGENESSDLAKAFKEANEFLGPYVSFRYCGHAAPFANIRQRMGFGAGERGRFGHCSGRNRSPSTGDDPRRIEPSVRRAVIG